MNVGGEGMHGRHRLDDVLVQHFPPFVQRVLHVGCGDGALGAALKRERGIQVFGIEGAPRAREGAAAVLDRVWGSAAACDENGFDCIFIPEWRADAQWVGEIGALILRLAVHGMCLIGAANPGYWRCVVEDAAPPDVGATIATGIARLELSIYTQWRIDDLDAVLAEAGPGAVSIEDQIIGCDSEERKAELRTVAYLFWCVRPGYDPLAHARDQLTRGRPLSAYDILLNIPEAFPRSAETRAAIAAEKQLCLLVMDRREGGHGRLARFARALRQFYHATAEVPGHALAFECQIRFWNLIGDARMAARLTRIYRQLYPEEAVDMPSLPPPREPEMVVTSNGEHGVRRVLMLTRSIPDYGLDVLFDGLCTVLGAENVVEFPWKPSLHGQAPALLAHYPCVFDRSGAALSEAEIIAEAAAGGFDLILYGELDTWMAPEFLRRLAAAAPDTPWAIVDQRDDPDDARPGFVERVPAAAVCAYFKRECLQCATWEGKVVPLPFAYPDGLVPQELPRVRSRGVFWAGHDGAGLRRAYLDHLGKTMGIVFSERVPQEAYRAALLESRIGLNFFGYGFDTVRYWELAAHGCMVLSDRLPIRVPHDFVEGESAVFFDDLQGLEERLRHYLSRPEEAEAIAAAGHARLLRYHTGSARARQMLGAVGG